MNTNEQKQTTKVSKMALSERQSEIIKLYSSGNTVTELSNRYGIARSTIYSWLNDSENKKLLNRKINMRDVFDLKQKCEQQEMMIEILKNAPCTVYLTYMREGLLHTKFH